MKNEIFSDSFCPQKETEEYFLQRSELKIIESNTFSLFSNKETSTSFNSKSKNICNFEMDYNKVFSLDTENLKDI